MSEPNWRERLKIAWSVVLGRQTFDVMSYNVAIEEAVIHKVQNEDLRNHCGVLRRAVVRAKENFEDSEQVREYMREEIETLREQKRDALIELKQAEKDLDDQDDHADDLEGLIYKVADLVIELWDDNLLEFLDPFGMEGFDEWIEDPKFVDHPFALVWLKKQELEEMEVEK